jgi:hypothetical protein
VSRIKNEQLKIEKEERRRQAAWDTFDSQFLIPNG